jgi:hypothetical protein
MQLVANTGLAIAIIAGLCQLGLIVVVTRAAVRGRQAPWMLRLFFGLAGAIMFGGELIALSVDLIIARVVGAAVTLTGLGVIGYGTSKARGPKQ